MLKELKRQLYLERKSLLVWVLVSLGVALLVTGIMAVITGTGADREVPAIGNIVLLASGGLMSMILSMSQTGVQFNLALKMGATRRHYLGAWFLIAMVMSIAVPSIGYLYQPLERTLLNSLGSTIDWNWQAPFWLVVVVGLAGTLIGYWFGAVLMRYGRKGFWIVYAVFFGTFVLSSQLPAHYMSDKTDGFSGFVKAVGGWLLALPVSLFTILGVVAALAIVVHSWYLLHNMAAQE